jgi:hypothetical protein
MLPKYAKTRILIARQHISMALPWIISPRNIGVPHIKQGGNGPGPPNLKNATRKLKKKYCPSMQKHEF